MAAKTYLELHPNDEILVLEAESSCGGTWSANRLYVRVFAATKRATADSIVDYDSQV